MILIVDHSNISVSYQDNALYLRRDDDKPQRIPLNLLKQVVIHGNPRVDMPVWRALADAAIPACLIPHRGSREPAMLAAGLAVRLPLRRLQYRCAEHPQHRIDVARWIVRQKFAGYDVALQLLDAGRQQAFQQTRAELDEKVRLADGIDSLMGLEGALARAWFGLLSETLPEKWRFTGRNRQPPRDPYNALLSLGYTLLMSDVRQVLLGEGLDPAFGYLHQPLAGREALTLDFTELFRGTVDFAMVLFLQELTPEDFSYSQTQGCRLTKSARPGFYRFWPELRANWPRRKADGIEQVALGEHIRGKVAAFREHLKTLDKENLDDE